jgi:hypothetical protein
MKHNPEYDFEETGDIVSWDIDYYVSITTNKKVNIVYTSENPDSPKTQN